MRLISLLVCICAAAEAHATSVIAFRADDFVVLGADSKVTLGDDSKSWSLCKIGVANNIFWGKAGILGAPAAAFDVDKIAREKILAATNIIDGVNAFEKAIMPPLTDVMNRVKRGSPDWYTTTREGKAALQTVFVGIDNNVPHMHTRSFKAMSDKDTGIVSLTVSRFDCPSEACLKNAYALIGEHDAIDPELERRPTIWQEPTVEDAIRELIGKEIEASPKDVGGPIAIVALPVRGAPQWLSEGHCAENAGKEQKDHAP